MPTRSNSATKTGEMTSPRENDKQKTNWENEGTDKNSKADQQTRRTRERPNGEIHSKTKDRRWALPTKQNTTAEAERRGERRGGKEADGENEEEENTYRSITRGTLRTEHSSNKEGGGRRKEKTAATTRTTQKRKGKQKKQ